MLLLPAAALCCLCSALLTTAEDLIQEDLTLTRRVGDDVSFSCGQTHICDSSWVYWYQKKDTETFRVILDIGRSDGLVYNGYGHSQEDDFSAVNKGNGCELQIQRVKLSHSATYYCSCWKSGYPIFGSGTKLFVGDEPVVKPVVSVYPAAPRAQLEGNSSLLCVASDMFPPLVQISWKRRKEDGGLELLPPADSEMLALGKSGCTASVMKLQQREESFEKYVCSVKHEGVRVHAQREERTHIYFSFSVSEVHAEFFILQLRVKLLSVLYSLLIVKSLVYCCGLSLLSFLINKPPYIKEIKEVSPEPIYENLTLL
ncbi:immunoglobulin lambda-1 light chain-like [Halichoeres trimaculatus]|uniref:immunoglobulin lambda-1 light chain-like n=1 Tax=Halichoeres trimaculatus TaxID=147232 RepID=UPI003D9ECD68